MIDLALITEFISPLILLACLAVGYILKNVVPSPAIDKWIPLIVGCLGIVLAIWNFGFIDLTIIVTGAISGLAASGLYETFKGLIEGIQGAVNRSNSTETETILIDKTIEGIDGNADTRIIVSELDDTEEKIATAKHKAESGDNCVVGERVESNKSMASSLGLKEGQVLVIDSEHGTSYVREEDADG